MNSKMTTNSQLSTPERKKQNKLSKQPEQKQLQKWRSHGGLSAGRGKNGDTWNKKHKWQVQNKPGG